jgi:hypothetical protein
MIGVPLYDTEIKEFLEYYTNGANVVQTMDEFLNNDLAYSFKDNTFQVIFIEPVEGNIGHWIVVFLREGKNGKPVIEYFNSTGIRPPEVAVATFDKWGVDWLYNPVQLQSLTSNTCGKWVISRVMAQDVSLNEYVAIFMENKEFSPDEIVDRLFRVKIMR